MASTASSLARSDGDASVRRYALAAGHAEMLWGEEWRTQSLRLLG